eukprot:5349710-Amphidinium_carterae.2
MAVTASDTLMQRFSSRWSCGYSGSLFPSVLEMFGMLLLASGYGVEHGGCHICGLVDGAAWQ